MKRADEGNLSGGIQVQGVGVVPTNEDLGPLAAVPKLVVTR
jgi:hypothetical protein